MGNLENIEDSIELEVNQDFDNISNKRAEAVQEVHN
jgi:hypothetical protein